ncbi:phosphatase PAP2 family protein [Cellulosimicrobium marinum]|uniref:phosphatase PAP2 family protein n=1 Tax=Cellulosimicrobium marinum TaxID=1638992 RepID=UPI001E4B690B|nr:phosphatase PAP2 family protein [Cellulosimicrobium marinum]MCB7136202.1 phosphatase PAP2 family protein [Cellulosimicrobium marinum]
MNTFVHRYELDTSRPSGRDVARDIALRALLPAAVLWAVVVGIGFLITGPLGDLPQEDGVNRALADARTPFLNTVTDLIGWIGTTEFIIGGCVLTIALVWWRTRQWWFAIVPGLAAAVQTLIFLTSSLVVGRSRPDVEQLDEAPPTSGFPSGHTGASAAFYLTLALLAQRVRNPVLRVALTVLAVLVPFAVGFSRLYRGMHSLSDVVVGLLNGLACAVLAWGYLRRDVRATARDTSAPVESRA